MYNSKYVNTNMMLAYTIVLLLLAIHFCNSNQTFAFHLPIYVNLTFLPMKHASGIVSYYFQYLHPSLNFAYYPMKTMRHCLQQSHQIKQKQPHDCLNAIPGESVIRNIYVIYTHTYIYMDVYIYTYIWMSIYIYMCVCVCVCPAISARISISRTKYIRTRCNIEYACQKLN